MESYWQLVDVIKITNLQLPFTSTTQQLTPGISSATCQLLESRSLIAVLPTNEMIVVGGNTEFVHLDKVEIAKF